MSRRSDVAVRARETGFDTATYTFERDGRHLELIGVVHIAQVSFWDRVSACIEDRIATGGEVHSEMIKGGPRPLPVRLAFRCVLASLNKQGLQGQAQRIDYTSEQILVTDFTFAEVVKAVGRPLALLIGYGSAPLHGLISVVGEGGRSVLFGDEFVSHVERDRPDSRMNLMHRVREQRALAALAATQGDVTSLWGAAHLPYLRDSLVALGWAHTGTTWHQALPRTAPEPARGAAEAAPHT